MVYGISVSVRTGVKASRVCRMMQRRVHEQGEQGGRNRLSDSFSLLWHDSLNRGFSMWQAIKWIRQVHFG